MGNMQIESRTHTRQAHARCTIQQRGPHICTSHSHGHIYMSIFAYSFRISQPTRRSALIGGWNPSHGRKAEAEVKPRTDRMEGQKLNCGKKSEGNLKKS